MAICKVCGEKYDTFKVYENGYGSEPNVYCNRCKSLSSIFIHEVTDDERCKYPGKEERNEEMTLMRMKGSSLELIAEKFGISRQRVYHIVGKKVAG